MSYEDLQTRKIYQKIRIAGWEIPSRVSTANPISQNMVLKKLNIQIL